MGMKKCKECGSVIIKQSKSCPKCGTIKNKTGCLIYIVAVAIISFVIIVISALTSTNKSAYESSASSVRVYEQKEPVKTEYTMYKVINTWWSNKLSDKEYIDEQPKAIYLFIKLLVRNNADEVRTVPPFKLVDEEGETYESSNNAYMLDKAIGPIDQLNPGIEKQGVIVFDVPRNKNYKLKISGGYWSDEVALVNLSL